MPVKKHSMKKTIKPQRTKLELSDSVCMDNDMPCCCSKKSWHKTYTVVITLAVILFLGVLVSKGYIVAAMVNNKPIFRFQLNQTMMSRFGKQTLEALISEKLITDEAKNNNVVITQQEIDTKEEEVLKSFGGKVTLEELLQFQGTTKAEFDSQIRLQLMVNKLLEKDVSISDEEITAYIDTNSALLVATDDAGLKEEAKQALTEQKINEKIQPWFTELKNKAKIFKFF